ncbi:MAG: 6-phosphofructokinase [Acidobacteria bacterium]|nr:6-phosphofructokinase [Acidobacteriota bacterium]MCK6682457.1 6-phosphofructokinase [Thermoanaerobaculia bacterium]
MSNERVRRLAILTSGGDAPGMNAVVRAAVRTALERGAEIFAVAEGFQGLVDGGDRIRKMSWNSVGGILQKGGTSIGTARCQAFRTREGRLVAAKNLIAERIDGLIVVGGDGSLTGADTFRREWTGLVAELTAQGAVPADTAQRYPRLSIVGLVGSIDNDFAGTDMTIGTDTALHRITEAIDALASTAASHQRCFVVEVMGRDCGYLALMSGLATGAGWVLIPEAPPDVPDWEERMCEVIREGHKAGRRHSTVIVAEGARDRDGKPIEAEYVRKTLQEKLSLEVRTTVLGHVQRGGAPSAFDRIMGTLLGFAAVEELLDADPDSPPCVLGIHENRVHRTPLMECVEKTRSVGLAIREHDYERAMDIRGQSFRSAFRIHKTLVRALPHTPQAGQRRFKLAVIHAGAPAPGMNTAVRAAVRLGIDQGHSIFGIRNGFEGFVEGEVTPLDWMSVHGFVSAGGAELGTSRLVPSASQVDELAKVIEKNDIQGLLIIGGWAGYEAAYRMLQARPRLAALKLPIVCFPAAIDNNLPGTEYSIGADTALNSIVEAVDKIKQSAVAWRRCVVVEVMGRHCGYLAALSALASGAERVYTHEEGITMAKLEEDLRHLVAGFSEGKRLGLMIRNENANPVFTTSVLRSLFEEEGKGLFDAREAILGHLQQGGNPTPFDRIQATRMAARAIEYLVEEQAKEKPAASYIGHRGGRLQFFPLEKFPEEVDLEHRRPKNQWWLSVLPVLRILAQPGPTRQVPPGE